MKQSDFYREIARVIDLCEGTELKYWESIKYKGKTCDYHFANNFSESWSLVDFTLALAIIENKPVFAGDYLYNISGLPCKVISAYLYTQEDLYIHTDQGGYSPNKLSWEEPKKTFTLNGEELPCPVIKRLGAIGNDLSF